MVERLTAITTYHAVRLSTYIPRFPQAGAKNIIEQMVSDGRLLPIGTTAERQSFAIVDEYRDPDRVDWHARMTDAVSILSTGEVIVRNNPELEKLIQERLDNAEKCMAGTEIGRVICKTLEQDAHAVRMRQGVVWLPAYEWGTLTKVQDIWSELCEEIEFFEFDVQISEANQKQVAALCSNVLDMKLTRLEVHAMRDLMRERVNPPNEKGIATKRATLRLLEYEANMYGRDIDYHLYGEFEDRFRNCEKTINLIEEELNNG